MNKALLVVLSLAYATLSIGADYEIIMNRCIKPSWEPDKVTVNANKMIITLNDDKVIPQVYYLQGNKLESASYLIDDAKITLFTLYPRVVLKNSQNQEECSYDIHLSKDQTATIPLEKQLLQNQQKSPPNKGPYLNRIDY